VTDSDGEEIMAVDEYSSPYEMISKSLCVGSSPGCYKLTVSDEFGDGLLFEDAIVAYLDYEKIYSSGNPTAFHKYNAEFGSGCSPEQPVSSTSSM